MLKRIIFGTAMIAALAAVFLLDYHTEDGPWMGVVTAGAMLPLLAAALFEYARIAIAAGTNIHRPAGLVALCLFLAVPLLSRPGEQIRWLSAVPLSWDTAVFLVAALVFANQMIAARLEDAYRRIAATLLGCVYVGMLGGLIVSLRIRGGIAVMTLFLASVKGTDIGAYFTGSFLGTHKMIPWLSPGKSWEGLAGGIVAAAVAGLAWHGAYSPAWPLWQCLVFSVGVGLTGQFGDLCESMLKRSAGIKDSGALIPEFGGVLDLLDSLLMAAPVGALLVILFGAT